MKENIKKFKDKLDKFGIIRLLVILIVICAVFQAGIFVGYQKARFYSSMGNNYRPFDDNRGPKPGYGGFDNFLQDSNLPGGHGAVGKIVSINLPNIVVASVDNVEKTVNISNDTLIRKFKNTISANGLKVGDLVIALGNLSPDNGVVSARLIRLLPPPPVDF